MAGIDLTPPDTPLGKEIPGWTRVPIPPVGAVNATPQWRVDAAAKMIVCTGQGGHEWLRYDREFTDFVLQVEWRFAPKEGETRYNSGIGIRLSRYGEIWYQAQTGLAGGWLFGVNLAGGELTRVNLREQITADAQVQAIDSEAAFYSALADYRAALAIDALPPLGGP